MADVSGGVMTAKRMGAGSRDGVRLTPIAEDTVRRLAYILGGFSAASQAIADLEKRRHAGEHNIRCFLCDDGAIVVGPDPFVAGTHQ